MVLDAFLSTNGDKSKIAQASTIYVTKKTVRFGNDVYQFRNVTGFGIGAVVRNKIPFIIILILFGVGSLPFLYRIPIPFLPGDGYLLPISLAIWALLFNIFQTKMYGLKLYVNSGYSQIFITSDTDWLRRAVGTLYDFMENAQKGSSMTIQVGGNIKGNIIQGGKARDVSSDIS